MLNKRLCGAACAFALSVGLSVLASAAAAGNPHGAPDGQASSDSNVAATTSVAAGATLTAGSSSSGHASAHGQIKKAAAASSVSSGTTVSTGVSAPSPKFAGCTASPSQGAGVQPNSSTLKWTCAAATSNQTKMYGNGQTAGQIATGRGGSGAMLFGPGNSQPHKVQACPNGKSHLVDVHAVKSYSTASCGQQAVTGSASVSANVSAATSTSTAVTAPTSAAATAQAASHAAASPSTSNAGGVKGQAHTSANANAAPTGTASTPTQGVLGAVAQQQLPFTGLPLWIVALAGLGALGTGLALRRVGRSHI